MRTEKRILTNTAVLGIGEAVGQVATFAFIVACGRVYGAGVLGWYSMGMAVGAIATVLATLGTHALLLRDLAQRPDESAKAVGGTLPYQIALSLLVLTVIGASLLFFVADRTGLWIVAALAIYNLTAAVASLLLIPLRARQIMWPSAVLGAAQRAGAVLIAVPLSLLGVSAVRVFVAFPVVTFVIAAVAFAGANRFLGGRLERQTNSLQEQRALYAAGMPFFGAAVLDVLYSRLGLLLLTVIASEESAGVYTAADRLLLIVSMFRVLFIGALYPAVAHFAAADRDRAVELSNRSMRLILVLTVPAAGLMAIFHREIIAIMFGPAFEQSAFVLLLLTPLLIIRGINGLWTSQATAVGLQRSVVRARALMVALFCVSGAALIALAGPVGLALALLLAECVYAFALRGPLVKEAFLARTLPVLAKPLIAVAAGAGAYVLLDAAALPARAAGVVAVMVAAVFATGAVRAHDLRYLRSILQHEPPP